MCCVCQTNSFSLTESANICWRSLKELFRMAKVSSCDLDPDLGLDHDFFCGGVYGPSRLFQGKKVFPSQIVR